MKRTVPLVALGFLLLGVGLALLLFVELLHAPRSHTIEGLLYLISSGALSLAVGIGALFVLSRYVPRLGVQFGAAFVFGSAAAIANVLVTPYLMFASHADFDILIISLVYFAAISLAFAFIAAQFTTQRMRSLRAGAMDIAAGDFSARVPERGTDEVGDLARAFNRMASELELHFRRERQMEGARRDLIAAVSHDLRTPLASIRAMVEAINDRVVTDEDTVQRYLNLIEGETRHLGALIDDLFELSQIESGHLRLEMAPVPLCELVQDTVDVLQVQARERNVHLQARVAGAVPDVALDAPRMQRVLVNLIQNALRHTPSGGSITVEVHLADGQVQLAVADTGEGIPQDDQPHIFDRFYRGEKSRSRDGGGAGLGLAIARGIVEAHRGTIEVESVPGQGSRFVVKLDSHSLSRERAAAIT